MNQPVPTPAEPPLPEVSVIVVNWNTRDDLRNCLASVQEQTRLPHEIIVIDNASRDGSAEMVAQDFPQAVLIANTENNGFAAANNQGLAIAKGRNLLLLNPDTLVLDGAIDKSLAWLAAHPEVGCMGCQVLDRPGVIARTCFADPGLLNQMISEFGLTRFAPYLPLLGRPRYAGWDRQSTRTVDVVTGMFMLVPRAVLQAVGPLDPGFFVYAEEADWCRRIRKAGWRCVFAPVAQIIHLEGGAKSTSQIRSKMFVQLQKSHLYYTAKHEGALAHALARVLYATTSALRLLAFGVLTVLRRDLDTRARVRLSWAALRYHLLGREPRS